MKCANDEHDSPSDGLIRLHEACHEKNSARLTLTRVLGLGTFFAALVHHLLAVTSSFDDGHELSAPEGARRCSPSFERVHQSFGSCEGDLEHHSRKDCLWLVRRDLDDDQSMFLPILCDTKLTAHLCPGILG